jgi:site-specific recombinase XerD
MIEDLIPQVARRCLPPREWPERDRAAWAAAHRCGGLLDDDGLAASWAPATADIIARGYGTFLAFLAQTNDLDRTASTAERATRPRIGSYIAYLRERNHSSTVAARILQLIRAIAVMNPTADLAWLRRIYARLRRTATPARDDRARLLPAGTMFELAKVLMQRAETETGRPLRRRALWFRDGLLIAMLCAWAPRSRNVAATMIGVSLQRRGAVWWATFGSKDTKNKRPIDIPLPDHFTPWIDRYLDYYRPQLACRVAMPAADDAFWISHRGKPLTGKEIGKRVSAVTKRELGRNINAHLFRKIIPTELAIRDPGHVGIAQPLLGHADYRTTQQAYNLGRALDAARRHQNLIQSIRAGASASAPSQQQERKGLLLEGTASSRPFAHRNARR